MLATRLAAFEDMFNHSGAELGEKISRDSSTLGNLITRHLAEFDRTVKTYGSELVERLGARTQEVTESHAQLRRQLRHPRHLEGDRGHHRARPAARRASRRRSTAAPRRSHDALSSRVMDIAKTLAEGGKEVVTALDKRISDVTGVIDTRGAKLAETVGEPHRRHRQGAGHARHRGCRHARRPHRPARAASGRARRSGDRTAGDAHPRRRRPAQRPARGAFHLDPHQLRGCRADARPAYRQDDGNAGQEHGGERRGNGGAQPQRRRGDRLAQSKRGRAERHHRQERCRRQRDHRQDHGDRRRSRRQERCRLARGDRTHGRRGRAFAVGALDRGHHRAQAERRQRRAHPARHQRRDRRAISSARPTRSTTRWSSASAR